MTLDELRDYAMLLRGNKMRSYQNAGTAMSEEQFRKAFAANMAQQGYANMDPWQVDVLASREWPKFKAGTSQYQFLAGNAPQAPMTASQAVSTPMSQPELSFVPPAISPDEIFPYPESNVSPQMSPYAQQVMDQAVGVYGNQRPTSPYAKMAMSQASGDMMGIASQMPAFLKSMQQIPVGTPDPRIKEGEEYAYEPRTSKPDRWDRIVAREQARKAKREGTGEDVGYGPQGADFFNNDSNGNNIPDYLEMAGDRQDQEASMFDRILAASAMFNPGGENLEGALFNIGRYAVSDSPYKGAQIGLSAGSAVMKGGRSLLSGLGYGKASREARDWYEQQMRRRQYNPVEQSAYGYTGDVANRAYGGLFRYQTGGASNTGELYKTALEQYDFFMKNPEAWEGDPEMTNPDGSFNLCLDCLNGDYNNPSDVNDAVRLINEGLSTGTHRNVDAFQQGLKSFNIPEPTFKSLKQNAMGGSFKYKAGGMSTKKPVDFANDPRFQPGEYVEFEYGGKMYKGTVKENNGKTISLK